MKKISLGAVAALFAITGAFAAKASSLLQTNYWFLTNAAGTPTTFVPGADMNPPSGCGAGTIPCAKAYQNSQVQPTHIGSSNYRVIPGQENNALTTALKNN